MQTYYVYPDGTITDHPYSWMIDDYYVLEAEDYEEAYEQAYLLGLI